MRDTRSTAHSAPGEHPRSESLLIAPYEGKLIDLVCPDEQREDLKAYGSRLVYPMEHEAMRYLNLLGNKFFSMAFSWLLGERIKDTLCGTKVLFRRDYECIAANRSYFGEFDPFGDFDLLFGASKLNLKILEVPIRYQERTYGETNIHRFTHGWLLLKMTVYGFFRLKAV